MARYKVAVIAIIDRYMEAPSEAEAQTAAWNGLHDSLAAAGLCAGYLAPLVEAEGMERRRLERYLDRRTHS